MKIIGFLYRDEGAQMVLKGDSCLLNGRKPMFIPDWTNELGETDCIIIRVSRLGKEVGISFASRYYDAYAYGADFVAMDKEREARKAGLPWTQALAFDYSLALGNWTEIQTENIPCEDELLMRADEAIVAASKVMTIRQGDLIYIQLRQAPRLVQPEEIIRKEINGEEKLYCKIK